MWPGVSGGSHGVKLRCLLPGSRRGLRTSGGAGGSPELQGSSRGLCHILPRALECWIGGSGCSEAQGSGVRPVQTGRACGPPSSRLRASDPWDQVVLNIQGRDLGQVPRNEGLAVHHPHEVSAQGRSGVQSTQEPTQGPVSPQPRLGEAVLTDAGPGPWCSLNRARRPPWS